MKLHPSDQKLIDFSIKVLYGFAQGLDDVHQMVKHPIDNILYPVSQFALDAAIILGNTPQMHDDPKLRDWQATMNRQEGIYTAACQRMKEHMSSIEEMGQAFWAADKLDRVRMATRLLTSTFAPGAIIRGIKTISTLSENLNTFGTKRPTLFHNLTIDDLPVATTPWKPITAEQVLGDRTSGFKKYIWVIVKDELDKVKLIMAERELNTPVLLRNGHEGAYLYHPEISGFKPVYSAGELHTYDGFIQKLTDKTGHFKVQPTWDGYPGFIEKVFQDNGYTHVAGKFEFAEAGVIKQPIMTVDPLGLTPGAEAFLSMVVSTMLRGTANSITNQAAEHAPRDYRKHLLHSTGAASSIQATSFSIPLPSLFGLFNHQLFGETKKSVEAQVTPWHAQINVPLPSKKLLLDSSDTMETACAKIDAYFEDIIRNYPESTKRLTREMYYRNKNVSQGELARRGAGAITWIEQNMFGMTRIKVQIDKELATSPIAIRMLKIHEIAVHVGQFHQRIQQVGFEALVQRYDEFAKFTEQSVAIAEKILTDALPEEMLSDGFIAKGSSAVCNISMFAAFSTSVPDAWVSRTNSNKDTSLDDYVHLQHRRDDKLCPEDHELFLDHPQVSTFLDSTVQLFYPEDSGKVASTALYRKALEERQSNPLRFLPPAFGQLNVKSYPASVDSTMSQQQSKLARSQLEVGNVSSQEKSESMDELGSEPADSSQAGAPSTDYRKFSPADQIHLYKCIRHDNPSSPILMSTSVLKFAESTTIFIYVVDQNGVITMGPEQIYDAEGKLQVQHHDQLIQSAPSDCVVLAGTIQVIDDASSNSRKYFVDNGSGHFEPRGSHQEALAKRVFSQIGVEINFRYAYGDGPIDYTNPPENLILISPTTNLAASSRSEAPPKDHRKLELPLPLSSIFQQLQADSEMSQQLPNSEQCRLSKGNQSSPDKSNCMDASGSESARQEDDFDEARPDPELIQLAAVDDDENDTIESNGNPGDNSKNSLSRILRDLIKSRPLLPKAPGEKRVLVGVSVATNHEDNLVRFPDAGPVEQFISTTIRTTTEEVFKKVTATATGVAGGFMAGPAGAVVGGMTGHRLIAKQAKELGREMGDRVHEIFGTKERSKRQQIKLTPSEPIQPSQRAQTRKTEIPHTPNRSASISHSANVINQKQRSSSALPQSPYERLLAANTNSTTTRMQAHHDAFAGMGLSDPPVASAEKTSGKTQSRIPISRVEKNTSAHGGISPIRVRWDKLEKVNLPIGNSFIFSSASAAEGPSNARPTKRHSQEAAPRDYRIPAPGAEDERATTQTAEERAKDVYMSAARQAQNAAQDLPTAKHRASPRHTSNRAETTLSRATDRATAQLTSAQVLEVKSNLQQLNKSMSGIGQLDYNSVQGRLSAQQVASNIGTIAHAVSDFGTIVQACGGGAEARRLIQIGANIATIADAVSGLIAAKAAIAAAGSLTASAAFSVVTCGISLVIGVVSLIGSLLGDDDNEAERFAAALAEVHADLRSLRIDMQRDFHALGKLLQAELYQLRNMVGQVIENDVVIFKSIQVLNEGIQDVKSMLGEHIETTNQSLKYIAHADLRHARDHIERYLDKTSVSTSEKAILKSLHELQFWLISELQSPVINEVHFAQIASERVVALLNQYQQTGTSMPGFFAARLRHHFGDRVAAKYTQLPSLELYEKTANTFLRGLDELNLSSYADYEKAFNHIIDTHKNVLEFIEMLKGNKDLCEDLFTAYSGYRHIAVQCITETGAQHATQLMSEVANSPRGASFKSALWAMEEQRLLLEMLAGYVDGCTPGDLTKRVLALDSLQQVCQQPQRLLQVREVLQITDRVSVPIAAEEESKQISYERELKKMLVQYEKAITALKAKCPKPVETQPAETNSSPESEVLDPRERQLRDRAQLFYDETDGIDTSRLTFFRRANRADPREQVLLASHLTGRQRLDFRMLLNQQDKRYEADTFREGDDVYIKVRLPEMM